MGKILLENIKQCLDSLSNTTNWVIGSVVTLFFSQDSKILGTDISNNHFGIAIFVVIIGLNLYIFKLTHNLFFFFEKTDANERSEAREIMESHLWICNPFSKTGKSGTVLIDDIGFGVFTILWWLGFSFAVKLCLDSNTNWLITMALSILYFAIGMFTAMLFYRKNKEYFRNDKRKHITNICLFLGVIFFAFQVTACT